MFLQNKLTHLFFSFYKLYFNYMNFYNISLKLFKYVKEYDKLKFNIKIINF